MSREPDGELETRTLGSRPEPKADAQRLSHPRAPSGNFPPTSASGGGARVGVRAWTCARGRARMRTRVSRGQLAPFPAGAAQTRFPSLPSGAAVVPRRSGAPEADAPGSRAPHPLPAPPKWGRDKIGWPGGRLCAFTGPRSGSVSVSFAPVVGRHLAAAFIERQPRQSVADVSKERMALGRRPQGGAPVSR